MQGLFLRLCSGGGVSVHGSRGVGSVANRAVCVSLIGESPSRAREHWAQLQPVPVEWGAFCALCCTRGKQRKAAHSDAVPFFGPRHFPFLCIGVVSTLPPPPPGNVYCFRHSREVLLFGYFQGSSRGTCILRPRIEVLIGLT